MAAERYVMAFLKQFEPLEASAAELMSRWDYKSQTGKFLTDIGEAIGVPRLGVSDEELVRRIEARIAINSCTGTLQTLYPAIRLLTRADEVRVLLHDHGTFDLELSGAELDPWGIGLLSDLPAAGCGIDQIRIYNENTFTLDDDNLGLDNGELL